MTSNVIDFAFLNTDYYVCKIYVLYVAVSPC